MVRLRNHQLFNKQNHTEEEHLGRSVSCVCVLGRTLQFRHLTDSSLPSPSLVRLGPFISGHQHPSIIYLATLPLVSNLLIRFEALWKSMPCVLIAFGFVTK